MFDQAQVDVLYGLVERSAITKEQADDIIKQALTKAGWEVKQPAPAVPAAPEAQTTEVAPTV